MASLYKKPVFVTDPKTGKRVKAKSKKWWGRFRDDSGRERRVPLAADKMAAETMLNELVRKTERTKAGIIDHYDEHRKRPLNTHLNDFEKHLRSRGVSQQQITQVIFRARRIVSGSNANMIGQLTASRVQAFLADLRQNGHVDPTGKRKKKSHSIQTSNHYLRSIKQFTRWLVKDRRAIDDPLAHIAMLNVSTDRRHDRRPLTETELTQLLEAARHGKTVHKMPGVDRAALYAVAAFTGLRASELASLTPENFDLDSDPSTVTVQAAYSKHRRQDILPLHPSIVTMLREWLATKPAKDNVWPGNWAKKKRAGMMMRRDLAVAKIPYMDANGLYADFHALRHTFITNMVKSGIAPKLAQSLARHSTIDLTMNVYTSLTMHDQASALASMPPMPKGPTSEPDAMRATGTCGPKKVPTMVPSGAENGAVVAASRGCQAAPDCTNNDEKPSAPTRKRLGKSPVKNGKIRALPHQPASNCKTEREGFEPSIPLRVYRFSRPAHSTALAPLRTNFCVFCICERSIRKGRQFLACLVISAQNIDLGRFEKVR